MSSGVEAACANWKASTEAAGNLTAREKGSFSFLIIIISYNARYAKLREVKKAHFPDFWRSRPGWLILGFGSAILHTLHFLSYLLLSLSHAYRLFLCYALLHRFVCNSFIPVSIYAPLYNISCCVLWFTVCGCGCSFVFVWTLLCEFLSDRFYGCSCMYGCWLLIMQIIRTHDVIRSSRIAP